MREMKDSGIEWIGNIPNEWQIIRLCYLIGGYKAGPFGSALIMDRLADEGSILVYTPEIIAENKTDLPNNKYLQEERLKEMEQFVVEPGDIIFPIVGSLGRAMLITEEMPLGIINQRLSKFRLTSDKLLTQYFLWLFAKSSFYSPFIEISCRGSIIVNLTKAILHDMPVILPSIEEQRKIAFYLDAKCSEIDEVISDIQSQIETLEEYKRSVITEAVTKGLDPDVEMKDSCVQWMGKIPKHWTVDNPKWHFVQRKDRATKGLTQLTASQKYGVVTQEEYMEITGAKVVTVEKDFDILKLVCPGDFIIHMRSFQGGLEYSEKYGSISAAYVMLIPQKTILEPRFYKWFFKSPVYIDALSSTSNLIRDGQAMRYANFIQLPIPLLPMEEQQQIADYLDMKCAEIDCIISEKKQQIETIEEYKKSLIFEYVTGKKEVSTQ